MTIDTDQLRKAAQKMPNLDWDSNQTPFYNDIEGLSRGGHCDGTYCVYAEDFEIDGESYEGPTLIERCSKDQAEFIAQSKPAILALLDELERLRGAIRYEQNVAERIGTHGENCHVWGPNHYECLLRYAKNARLEGYRLAQEQAARVCEKNADDRFAEYGVREWDTNCCYYPGSRAEEFDSLDEEDNELAQAIRALPPPAEWGE